MLNFGASLQQAAVSHLGMPLSFLASPRLRARRGANPEPLTSAAPENLGCSGVVGEGGLPACRLVIGEDVCIARGSGEGLNQETRERGLAQGVMRGRGSSTGRLEAGKEEVNRRSRKSEEGDAALAVIGKGMEGEGGTRGPPCTWRRGEMPPPGSGLQPRVAAPGTLLHTFEGPGVHGRGGRLLPLLEI